MEFYLESLGSLDR